LKSTNVANPLLSLPLAFAACSSRFILIRRMIGIMMDVNNISEHLSSLKQEMSDLRVATARYWNRKEHTPLDKSAFALRHDRLVQSKQELADMMKRCA